MTCPASPNCPYCDDDGEWERRMEEADEEARLDAFAEGEPLDELDMIDRDAALASMGEPEDSLMLGGCGGTNDAEDTGFY